MLRQRLPNLNRIATLAMFTLGVGLLLVSAFFASSFLAILAVSFLFWCFILLYITPSKHVPLTLLNASAEAAVANIERVILEFNLTARGVYLPPRNLGNSEFSLVFIPETLGVPPPALEETNERLLTSQKTGVLIIPPGLALSRLWEEKLGFSFTKTNLDQIQKNLPKLLVDDLELVENAEIQVNGNTAFVKIKGSILYDVCRQTDSQPKTHNQVGCMMSSAIACALAKSSGKPVIIQNEQCNRENKITYIEYQILEV